MTVLSVSEWEKSTGMADNEELSIVKRKIVAVDKLVRNKQKVEGRNTEMGLLLEATQKELEEANIVREEMEDDWEKKMKKKEEELDEMSLLLEATQKELDEANVAREESVEKFGKVGRVVWKQEEEMKKMEDEWKNKMKKKEEELEDKDNQIMRLRSELAKEKKEKEEAKEELDTIKHTYVSIGDLLSRKRAGLTDLADGSSH